MKKIMLIVLSLALTIPALAQYGSRRYPTSSGYGTSYSQHHYSDIYYGLRLGAAFSTVNSDDKRLDGGSVRTGLRVGGVVGFQLGYRSPMYFETGLMYVEKGGEGKYENAKFTYGLDYLEVPLVLKYWYDVDRSFSIQPFLGGYLAVGVAGKIKDFGHRQAYSSFDDEGFQRFDGGIKVGCGVQFDLIYAELGYDFGLANISHDYFDTSHTGSFFVTIGVNF